MFHLFVFPAESSGSDTDSEDSTHEMDTDAQATSEQQELHAQFGSGEEITSKAKQSRSEKKARKAMSKLGLKSVTGQSATFSHPASLYSSSSSLRIFSGFDNFVSLIMWTPITSLLSLACGH